MRGEGERSQGDQTGRPQDKAGHLKKYPWRQVCRRHKVGGLLGRREERKKAGKGKGTLRIINQLLMNAKLAGGGEDLRHQKTTDNRSLDQVNKVAGKAR